MITLADEGIDKCGMGDSKDGCCKIKYQFFKVKDKHVSVGELLTPVSHDTEVVSSYATCTGTFIPQQVDVINGSHSPPLYTGVPIYISNCVFRV